ncbi:MAG: glycosyltransferase family 2 protein [Burkholderiaceae bacterium]
MKISVVTVAFNSAATIADTLRSISSQSHADVEHLVIDGGSTDGTLDIVRSWTGHAVRLVSEPDEGIYDAMNKGFALASGEIIGFLNSDDFYASSSVLAEVVEVFRNASVGACHADLAYVTPDNRRVVRYWQSKSFVKGAFALGWCPAHPTFYVRKSVIARFGVFDKSLKLAADAELMMRYLERNGVRSVYIPRVWVRMRLGGQTNQSLRNIVQQNREILFGLRANGIPYSTLLFAINKIRNRIWQFVAGRMGQHEQ